MLKAIIFDFDGVIVESVEGKTRAFRELFAADYPDKVDEIVAYHTRNGGLSRYKKFEYIYRVILKEDLTRERSDELGRRFTELAYQGVVNAPFVDGAQQFLDKYCKRLALFVASGTPHEEIVKIVGERGLDKYFKGVYGSPDSKADIVRTVLKKTGLKAEEALFVGDAMNDYTGAEETGVPFIGRIHTPDDNPFAGLAVKGLIGNLSDLENLMKEGQYVI